MSDPNIGQRENATPLFVAAQEGHTDLARELIPSLFEVRKNHTIAVTIKSCLGFEQFENPF